MCTIFVEVDVELIALQPVCPEIKDEYLWK